MPVLQWKIVRGQNREELYGISIKHHYPDESDEDEQLFKSDASSTMDISSGCTVDEKDAL